MALDELKALPEALEAELTLALDEVTAELADLLGLLAELSTDETAEDLEAELTRELMLKEEEEEEAEGDEENFETVEAVEVVSGLVMMEVLVLLLADV